MAFIDVHLAFSGVGVDVEADETTQCLVDVGSVLVRPVEVDGVLDVAAVDVDGLGFVGVFLCWALEHVEAGLGQFDDVAGVGRIQPHLGGGGEDVAEGVVGFA